MMKAPNILYFFYYIWQRFAKRDAPESIYFFTFHKCASSLFSDYVLKNIKGLRHIDYMHQIYHGKRNANKKLIFKKRGYIYGPVRLSQPTDSDSKIIISSTTEPEFIRDKIGIFLVRDPRDIIVSSYYSFGYSHNLSRVKEIRERQIADRNLIQNKSLDEYALDSADVQAKYFEILGHIAMACERSVILKYEDMINDFELFISQLCRYVTLDKKVIKEIYQRTRPKQEEDQLSHRRSGKTGDFRTKLKKETIESLNKRLEKTLSSFGYEE